MADWFGLALQDLCDQIVYNVAVISSEGSDESRNILVALHGKRG
jgi:hypothetical protein